MVEERKIPTDFEYQVLKLIQDNPNIRPKAMANELWPGSKMHERSKNTGNGACRGKGAWLLAGSVTGKLEKKKLLYKRYGEEVWVRLTDEGKQAIEDYETMQRIVEGRQAEEQDYYTVR